MRIAAYQFAVSGNIIENFKEIENAIYLAKRKNVQLLIFPECSLTGYPSRDIANSSCIDFNLVHAMCDKLQIIADENEICFIVGTIYKEEEIYNRAMLFQPDSQIKFYDKRALWDGIRIISRKVVWMEYLKWKGYYLVSEFVLKSDFLNSFENYTNAKPI
jgi:predicted amidohydrolase